MIPDHIFTYFTGTDILLYQIRGDWFIGIIKTIGHEFEDNSMFMWLYDEIDLTKDKKETPIHWHARHGISQDIHHATEADRNLIFSLTEIVQAPKATVSMIRGKDINKLIEELRETQQTDGQISSESALSDELSS